METNSPSLHQTQWGSLDTEALAWQEILDQAMVFASKCGKAYRQASDHGRRTLNKAVIERIDIRNGTIADVVFQAPFDLLFSKQKFEYERFVEVAGIEPIPPGHREVICRSIENADGSPDIDSLHMCNCVN